MSNERGVKPILWVSSSKRDLMEMPPDVITDFGFGLYQAQIGEHPDIAKTLSGFGSSKVINLSKTIRATLFERSTPSGFLMP